MGVTNVLWFCDGQKTMILGNMLSITNSTTCDIMYSHLDRVMFCFVPVQFYLFFAEASDLGRMECNLDGLNEMCPV